MFDRVHDDEVADFARVSADLAREAGARTVVVFHRLSIDVPAVDD